MVGDERGLPASGSSSNLQVASRNRPAKDIPTTTEELEPQMTAISDLQSAITAVAEKAGTSIVGIGSRQRGSGVVLADGKVLTNAHNVRGDEVTVTFSDGRSTR